MQARALLVLALLAVLAGTVSAQLDDLPQWSIEGVPWTHLGVSCDGAGDVNGDGKADAIVGIDSHKDPVSGVLVGAVQVFYGGSSASPAGGLDPSQPDWTCTGEGGLFGRVVRGVGDLNDDGYDDVAVGAPSFDPASASPRGAVYVFYGSPGGLKGGPAATFADADWRADGIFLAGDFGVSIAGPGDLSGDGIDDLLIAASKHESDPATQNEEGIVYAWLGATDLAPGVSGLAGGVFGTPTNARFWIESDVPAAKFGQVMTAAGDMDGDLVPDFAVRAEHGPTDVGSPGRVWFLRGGDYTGKVLLEGPAGITIDSVKGATTTNFGDALAGGFDFDADGFHEVAVGIPNGKNFATDLPTGDVAIYEFDTFLLAGVKAVSWHPVVNNNQSRFGYSLTSGDFDGDGFVDLAVGEPLAFDVYPGGARMGAVNVFSGKHPDGLVYPLDTFPSWRAFGGEETGWFGKVVASAGDVHGDVAIDLLVSTDRHEIDPLQPYMGQAFLYGGDAPLIDSPCLNPPAGWTWEGNPYDPIKDVGSSVAGVGDVDGDGYEDVLVGASQAHFDGRAYLFRGGPDGLEDQPSWTGFPLVVEPGAAYYGFALDSAGDVNADGFPDVIVGAPGSLAGSFGYMGGRAHVYHGGTGGLSPLPDWTARDDGFDPSMFGCSVAGLGDVDFDGIDDVAVGARGYFDGGFEVPGRVYVWHGSAGAGLNGGVDGDPLNYGWAAEGQSHEDWFGTSIAPTGELDGAAPSGTGGIVVGAPLFEDGTTQPQTGRAYVWPGALTIPAPVMHTAVNAPWMVTGEHALENLGASVAGGVDWNGDGRPEVAVGGPVYGFPNEPHGRVLVFHGDGTLLPTSPSIVLERPQPTQNFGFGLAFVDDFDGLGKVELAVGASATTSPQGGEGRVFLFEHDDPDPIFQAESDSYLAGLGGTGWGRGVADAGDVDGDGVTDFVAGANRFIVDGYHVGRVYLWEGGPAAYLDVTPNPTLPGQDVTLTYMGAGPGTNVYVGLSDPSGVPITVLVNGTIGPDGCFQVEVEVPPGTPPGTYYLIAGHLEPGFGFVFSDPVAVVVL